MLLLRVLLTFAAIFVPLFLLLCWAEADCPSPVRMYRSIVRNLKK